jgi:hypothetical protein
MRVTTGDADEVDFRFWHGPHGQWRIEHDGEAIYLSGAGEKPLVWIDGHMQRQGGDFGVVDLGSQFSPLDLLGPESLLARMSQGMRESEPPHRIELGGRVAWSTTLVSASDHPVEIAFDDGTGILVKIGSPERGALFDVSDIVEHTELPATRFSWDGPVVEAEVHSRGRRRPATDPRERHNEMVEVLTANAAAQERPHDVLRVIAEADGDTAARTAIMALLGVSERGADAVTSMQLSQFRPDVVRETRAGLIRLSEAPPDRL